MEVPVSCKPKQHKGITPEECLTLLSNPHFAATREHLSFLFDRLMQGDEKQMQTRIQELTPKRRKKFKEQSERAKH